MRRVAGIKLILWILMILRGCMVSWRLKGQMSGLGGKRIVKLCIDKWNDALALDTLKSWKEIFNYVIQCTLTFPAAALHHIQ